MSAFVDKNNLNSYSSLPRVVAENHGRWPEPKYRFSLAACARWEARYISEWLSYHRSIGIEHVYLYCNDDDPAELYQAVLPFLTGNEPFVTFVHYPFQGLQFQMYFHFARNYIHETEWMMFLDIDEFFFIRSGELLGEFIESFPSNMDALYINWCSFGSNGHKTRPVGSVLLNYTKREKTVTPFTKVLIKSKTFPYKEFFENNNHPIQHDYTGLNKNLICRNTLGEDMAGYYDNFPWSAWGMLNDGDRKFRILDVAFIAHFNIKSDEDFDLRVKRGLHGDYAAEKMWGDKSEEERSDFHLLTNAVEDYGLHDYWHKYLSDKAWKTSPFPASQWPLISTNCKTLQSSSAHPWGAEADSQNLINRRPNGRSQAHTEKEEQPWWQIDLGSVNCIQEIRIFNRLDVALERMCHFSLFSSLDGENWNEFYHHNSPEIFGGIDGTPFIWLSDAGVKARFMRVVVNGEPDYLNLDQVEVYGFPDFS
ncbi:glycosyltransferase family 2 protein [Acetobacter sicerae]|uniref:glycosyltransferase family 2 protein n=1 Tax=Acetobacter sicerae TaxID=85325 RepID=UPI00156AA8A6|nr:glycosyltransferase family 2 protein [Acetobacter sicerae]NHN93377.1 glycosyltransferase family 92 protein [Acetobacter sicerae]